MSNFKYQYILAIAELQSFSKAADALLTAVLKQSGIRNRT